MSETETGSVTEYKCYAPLYLWLLTPPCLFSHTCQTRTLNRVLVQCQVSSAVNTGSGVIKLSRILVTDQFVTQVTTHWS